MSTRLASRNGAGCLSRRRRATDEEFEQWFNDPEVTGLGVITGEISGLVVVDEDSYKADGMSFKLTSPMVAKSARGGRHHYFRYTSPVRTSGFRQGVNIEIKSDGGFIVLPPSQVLIDDAGGKGLYTWLSHVKQEELPTITEEDLKDYKLSTATERVDLHELTAAPLGQQHNNLRTIATSMFNRFPRSEWDIAAENIRAIAAKFDPPHPEWRVEKMIKDAMAFVEANPPTRLSSVPAQTQVSQPASGQGPVKTAPVFYSEMNDEQMSKLEDREALTTGLPQLDSKFKFRSGFYIICANPGAGKGFFATWLARQFYSNFGKRSVLFSLEMGEPLVRSRILQQWSDLTPEQLEQGADTLPARELLREDAITVYPFGKDDGRYQTPENFRQDVISFYERGCRIFFFDHLHELEGANVNDKNQSVVEAWAKAFQALCIDYPDIWLFVFAQPNGAAESKGVIRRTDISGTKSITQKCEFFLSLNRSIETDRETGMVKVDEQNREVLVWVDKNRISPQQYVGAKIWLSRTGNFTATLDADVQSNVHSLGRRDDAPQPPAELQLPAQKRPAPLTLVGTKRALKHGSPEWLAALGRHLPATEGRAD
jgi:hypothetical protein